MYTINWQYCESTQCKQHFTQSEIILETRLSRQLTEQTRSSERLRDASCHWIFHYVTQDHSNDLVCDPTILQPDFNLPRQQWPLLNSFRTEQGHWGACRRKWQLTDTDLCPCGETLTISHIVKSCPLTKLNGGLSRLHSANEDAVLWLTSYGSSNAHEKKKKIQMACLSRARLSFLAFHCNYVSISYSFWDIHHQTMFWPWNQG